VVCAVIAHRPGLGPRPQDPERRKPWLGYKPILATWAGRSQDLSCKLSLELAGVVGLRSGQLDGISCAPHLYNALHGKTALPTLDFFFAGRDSYAGGGGEGFGEEKGLPTP
jgi:hypothetical protein